jgi:hypothetical protein
MKGQSAGYHVPSVDQNHIAIEPRETKNEIRLGGFDRASRLFVRAIRGDLLPEHEMAEQHVHEIRV